jgi:hypothetical protein
MVQTKNIRLSYSTRRSGFIKVKLTMVAGIQSCPIDEIKKNETTKSRLGMA